MIFLYCKSRQYWGDSQFREPVISVFFNLLKIEQTGSGKQYEKGNELKAEGRSQKSEGISQNLLVLATNQSTSQFVTRPPNHPVS